MVCWNVDDLLIGQAKPETVTWFLTLIARCYNTPNKKLTSTRGSYHNYLGHRLLWSWHDEIWHGSIHRQNYWCFPWKDHGSDFHPGRWSSFCGQPLNWCLSTSQRPSTETTAQLLFLSRVCHDIQTPVSFLATRVKHPEEDDWGETQTGCNISRQYLFPQTNSVCWISFYHLMVCWCFTSDTQRMPRSHWCHFYTRAQCSAQLFH